MSLIPYRAASPRSKAKAIHASLFALTVLFAGLAPSARADQGDAFAEANSVVWTTPGTNENDSMPIGNGDLAANVWTEQNGDLVILIAKSDSWSETGDLLKLGRVRIHFAANPFDMAHFSQTLRIVDGSIVIKDDKNLVRIWVDANNPVIHTEIALATPTKVEAAVEIWRDAHARGAKPDVVLPAGPHAVRWLHLNTTSDYPRIMTKEHLESLLAKYPDPLLGRAFGAALLSADMSSVDDRHLQANAPRTNYRIDIVGQTEANAGSVQAWNADLVKAIGSAESTSLDAAWQAHRKWWQDFWNRSWISLSGTDEARAVSQGYAMQRYMIAASSRGAYPTKFNGGLFTVGHDLTSAKSTNADHDPDYRAWGSNYWNQNNRLLYWPLVESGDFDLIQPWFKMYTDDLPLAKDRVRLYYGHDGASLPETMYFFGVPRLGDFGTDNPTNVIQSNWQRYHIQGVLEVAAQMLDYYQYTEDETFARTKLIPFADAVVTFYDQHWPRDAHGKVEMSPAQSLETYQLVAVNPTPDVAGLMSILPRMLALPQNLTTDAERKAWAKLLADLPPLPIGTTTAAGKTPPFGAGDASGKRVILPAERYGKTSNSENPELYVAFPYRLYGVGKPDLGLAQDTFAARRSPANTCWGQDGTQSAVLGLTDVAKKAAVAEFTNYGDQRFKWFWRAAHDWIPDLDNGGSGMITLQLMLMQADDKHVQLAPTWPADWTADFKLHGPHNTIISGHVEKGVVSHLEVTPKTQASDIVLPSGPSQR